MNIKWSLVKNLGNSKIVVSNYFWIFIIPFVAKNIEQLNQYLGLSIEITFSLSKLFYASLCFSIATIIYQIRCPSIIKEQNNFQTLSQEGKGPQHVANYFKAGSEQFYSKLSKATMVKILEDFDNDDIDKEEKTLIEFNEKWYFVDNKCESKFFWQTYEILDESFNVSVLISLLFYILGIVFLTITAVFNAIFALSYFLPQLTSLRWLTGILV
ncbi:hypothetical protein BTO01_18855 [Vibrio jasicida]|uniref:hypothetical protein n=1 Tax=Vibrio jasicida TaxID=766224 RepID=UPI000CF3986B|nr:hypothetical protein [Vibrio jasicida]PQJ58910.1 hypothetical protein BTO01_18855 [Vibrio jasicida]